MARLYWLTNPDPDPVPEGFSPQLFLQIQTDDTGTILDMRPPAYRSSDGRMASLIREWQEHLTIGSPLPEQTITVFSEYVQATYGPTAYWVRRKR